MSVGAVVDLIVTLVLGALLGIVAYLIRGRFDAQAEQVNGAVEGVRRDVSNLQATVQAQAVLLAQVAEAQRGVVASQATITQSQARLVNDADDLEDICDQLQDATRVLRERMTAHDEYHRRLAQNGLGT